MDPVINWQTFFFLLFALVTGLFAIAVVLATNVVRMAFYLTISLGATSGLFFLAGADFVGAMQLMIYVGGTLVLLIFGVMLTAQGPFVSLQAKGGDWVIAAVVGGALLALLVTTALRVEDWHRGQPEIAVEPTATQMGLAMLGVRTDQLEGGSAAGESSAGGGDTPAAGRAGLAGYLLPFEVVSVHLLVVLIGAAYLARSKRRPAASA